jgi:hypothetical protein
MCLAKKYINDFGNLHQSLLDDQSKLTTMLSEVDRKISQIYHKIETSKFNAAEGFWYAKQLQRALQERRVIKNEFYNLKHLADCLNGLKLKTKLNEREQKLKHYLSKQENYTSNFDVSIESIM